MAAPKLKTTVEKTPQGFAVLVNGKPLKTPKGAPWACHNEALANATATEVAAQGLNGALYKLQSYIIDTPAHTTCTEIADHFETDLVFYEASTPADLAAHQNAAWAPVRTWLSNTLGGVPFTVTHHTTLETQPEEAVVALQAHVEGLDVAQRAVAYFAGRLSASVAIGLAFAAKELDAEKAHTASHADEYYQEARYKKDDLLTERLEENKKQLVQLQIFRDLSY